MNDLPFDAAKADQFATSTRMSWGTPGLGIGPYRLLEQLGEGGMGEVWLAEQTVPVRRHVAVKIVKSGMDTAQVVARFEAERQALALMDHPAIAKVFDAGATELGRPYFAMEFVRGESLTAYCDRHRLTPRQRLDLFVQICEGVQHAHQKGIIHRDLKPSNILITSQDDRPVPKIIDFGVAKAVSQPLTERTLYTSLTGFVGTAEYMSPEQAELGGIDIDTRTDVYSLGVVLYELLTGVRPFDSFKQKGLDEIRQTIRKVVPAKPSTRLTQLGPASAEAAASRSMEPARLTSLLRGDLDWITMKTIDKDRARRYGSASDLAADITRHLSHQPVLAGPPSAVYRTKKFVQRHRFGVATAAAFAALLVAFATTMTLQARRIARERDRANVEAQTARQVSQFLIGLFEVSKPNDATANSVTAREILDKGSERIRQELHEQPATRGSLLSTMGRVYQTIGLYQKARTLDEEALELRRGVFGPRSAEAADSLTDLASATATLGHLPEAERMYRDGLELRRSLYGNEHVAVADSLSGVADIAAAKGDYREAERLHGEALRIRRKLLGETNTSVAASLTGIAGIQMAKADWAGAEQTFREALAIDTTVRGPAHWKTIADRDNVASALLMQGKYAEAETAYRQNLTETIRTLGPRHADLETVYGNLGGALYFQQKYAEAEVFYRRAIDIAEEAYGKEHPLFARQLSNLAQALDAQARYAEAVTLYQDAISIERRALGHDHPAVAVWLAWLSGTFRHLGRLHDAEAAATEALDINRRKLGLEHPRTKEAEGALGAAECAQRNWKEAEPLLVDYATALKANIGVEGNLAEVTHQIASKCQAGGEHR